MGFPNGRCPRAWVQDLEFLARERLNGVDQCSRFTNWHALRVMARKWIYYFLEPGLFFSLHAMNIQLRPVLTLHKLASAALDATA